MDNRVTFDFKDNFIEKLADFITRNSTNKKDFTDICCVFGGRRPALFLRREIAKRVKGAFLPPTIFSIDEFVDFSLRKKIEFSNVDSLDASFCLYELIKKDYPEVLFYNEKFSKFLPWAQEVISFFEQLELEMISDDLLLSVERSAAIGYEVPEVVNSLLRDLSSIKKSYYKKLIDKNEFSRGIKYGLLAKNIEEIEFPEFKCIYFCNFYYLHKSEKVFLNSLIKSKKAKLFLQGSKDSWPVLAQNAKEFGIEINSGQDKLCDNFSLYEVADQHCQVAVVREILKEIKDYKNTVIVLPKPEAVIPLLSETVSFLEEFNVSIGYPLKRTPVYELLNLIFKTHSNKKENVFYSRDYITLLRHPLIKNIDFGSGSTVTRVIVHKLEDFLTGKELSSVSGMAFVGLDDLINEENIFKSSSAALTSMDMNISASDCKLVLDKLHTMLFKDFFEVDTFGEFSLKLSKFFDLLVNNSMINSFAFNCKVLQKLYEILDTFLTVSFKDVPFFWKDIVDVFDQRISSELVSFLGSPLRGVQILGLLETRSLNFDNVIIIDVNESVLPKMKIYEPLIPREIMLNLGLNRLEKEEEIQRYQFMRLVSAAKKVHLVYLANESVEKSRFVESLIWDKQCRQNSLELDNLYHAGFSLKISSEKKEVEKTEELVRYLKKSSYSASRVNSYLNCPLQFYYRYCLGVKEGDDLLDDLEAKHIGNFIHELLEQSFGRFVGRKPVIDHKFKKYFFQLMDKKFKSDVEDRMKSDAFLIKKIIYARMDKFLEAESKQDIGKIISLEKQDFAKLNLAGVELDFVYTADRIDQYSDGTVVIIDYKTGGADIFPKRLSSLVNMSMSRESIKDSIKSFQLPLYYRFISDNFSNCKVNAQLYNLRTLKKQMFISDQDYKNTEQLLTICFEALDFILSELFDINVPFKPVSQTRYCQYCPYKGMC